MTKLRLLHFTAGAAGMYCGSCLRDNALAASLLARGHDVLLTPLYTPTNPDSRNVSSPRVFFGGISVYLQQHVPLFRYTPAALDRLWDAEPIIRLASKRQIKIDPAHLGAMTVSMLRGEEGFQRKEIGKLLDWLKHEPKFDSITLPNSLLVGLARPLRKALGAPVACVLQGEDLFLDGLGEPWKAEALSLIHRAADDVDVFLSVSDYYSDFMPRYLNIPPSKVRTLRLGIDFAGYSRRPERGGPPYTVGYFARIAPEKGLHALADAYIRLRKMRDVPPTRLVAGGYLLPEHRTYLESVTNTLAEAGLADHFTYAGAPDREGKIALLGQMDVLSVPAPAGEPKGISVLEAMARGVPVVQPRRGAFIEMLERTRGGILVPPDNPDALAAGLFVLLTDRACAATYSLTASNGVRKHYSLDRMAEDAEAIYRDLRC